MNKCCICNSKTISWIRHTKFSGDHPFCLKCAEKEENFSQDNPSYFYWEAIPSVKFKFRNSPKKPKRATQRKRKSLHLECSLKEVLDDIPDDIDLRNILFEEDIYDNTPYFYWTEPEPIEQYNKKLAKYEKQLIDYNKWAEDNKDKITTYLALQKKTQEERQLKSKQAQKIKLEKELKKL